MTDLFPDTPLTPTPPGLSIPEQCAPDPKDSPETARWKVSTLASHAAHKDHVDWLKQQHAAELKQARFASYWQGRHSDKTKPGPKTPEDMRP
jgi:hypothetical protein